MKSYSLYDHPQVSTLKELLLYCTENHKNKIAFSYTKKKETLSVSYEDFERDINFLGTYLFSKGFKNCHIAVLGENSYNWILTHFAVTCGGNVIVPVDKELDLESITELLVDSSSALLVYSDTYNDIAEELKKLLSDLTFINMNELPSLIEKGAELLKSGNRAFTDTTPEKNTLASIVYTSGTTGKSKGVMLTHGNFASDAIGACRNVAVFGTSILLLPLHHTFGLVAAVFSEMMYGFPIYINSSYKRILQDFQKAEPQNFFAVPLIAETLYKNIWKTAQNQGKDKALKKLIKISNALLRFKIDLRKIFFSSVINSFGGNLETIICGGAPLNPELVNDFNSLGITVLNGYGITECS
ncbi:MAG: AMP-binding protein, partial [Clostridia bacterium]|nr:AMP-binding protein [Clostridia bacterium]